MALAPGFGIDWNFSTHEGFISERGDTVIHEIGLRCTCNMEDTFAGIVEKGTTVPRRRTKLGCEKCYGEGYVYRDPRKITALVTSYRANKLQMDSGWAYPGDVLVSTMPGYVVSAGDRFTFPWEEPLADGQVIMRGAASINDNSARKIGLEQSEDKLWYCAIRSIYCEDSDGNVYSSGADFVLDGSKIIKWIGASPRLGQSYTIKYTAYPEWIAFMPPDLRQDRGRDLGSRVGLRRRHIVNLNDNYAASIEDRVPFCDRITCL